MRFNRDLLIGVLIGVALVYAYHHFVAPLPMTGRNPAAKRPPGRRRGG